MRTTLTLENDVDERLREIAFREKKPYKVVVNEVLRHGLGIKTPAEAAKEPFRVIPFEMGLPKEWEGKNLRHLADDLEDEERLRKLAEG